MSISRSISIIVTFIGLIVIIGWALDFEIIKRIYPGLVAMNPATAVVFILSGLSLFLFSLGAKYKFISYTLSLIIFLIGALKLLEIIFGIQIGVDQILFKEKLSSGLDSIPNRIAPNTAINITLIGLSLMLFNHNYKFFKLALILTVIVAVISVLAIFGYTYNFAQLYGISSFIPMALHTAASFLLLSLGIILNPNVLGYIKSDFVVKKVLGLSIRIKLLVSFGSLVILLIMLTIFTYINIDIIQNTQIPARASIRNSKVAVLELRRYEKDFLSRDVIGEYSNNFFKTGSSENVKKWEENYQIFLENVTTLEKFYLDRNDSSRIGELNKIKAFIKEYHDYFINLEEVYMERGFEDYGLEGQMRKSIRALESDLTNPSLLVLLLQARRSEKDFFLRNDPSELERFNSSTFELSKKLRGKQLETLNDYIRDFNKIVELETSIGFKIDEGIIGRMRHAINKLEPSLALEEEYILYLTNQNIDAIKRLIVTLAVVFTIMSILLAYYISKAISQNVSKLEEERAKDDAILNSIGDGVFVVDRDSKIVMMNRASEHLTGYNQDEAVGKLYSEIFNFRFEKTPDQPYPQFVQEVIKSNKALTLEKHTVLVARDGTNIPIGDSASPVVIGQKDVFGCVVVIRDVKLEREVDRAKTEFVSLASHELKTPLGIMKWYMESLIDDASFAKLPDQTKEYLTDIYKSNERVLGVVRSLLDVSRIDEGRVKDEPVETDINKLILEKITELKPEMDKRSVTATLGLQDKNIQKIIIDPQRLGEVILNLLSNATKYNKTKGQIKVNLGRIGDMVKIEISDTGIGIPQSDLPKLFNKFFRADNAVKSATDGTGLGLYMIRSYVEAWGGSVSITSNEGEGTTAILLIPQTPNKLNSKL